MNSFILPALFSCSLYLAVPQTAGQDPEDMTKTDPEMFMLPMHT
jgi:hypothetical protein